MSRKQYQPGAPGPMTAWANDRLPDSRLSWPESGPMLGEVHGAALAVGPHTPKVMVPVGEPWVELPVTVAVSVSLLPSVMLALLSDDVSVGVLGFDDEPVA